MVRSDPRPIGFEPPQSCLRLKNHSILPPHFPEPRFHLRTTPLAPAHPIREVLCDQSRRGSQVFLIHVPHHSDFPPISRHLTGRSHLWRVRWPMPGSARKWEWPHWSFSREFAPSRGEDLSTFHAGTFSPPGPGDDDARCGRQGTLVPQTRRMTAEKE